MKNISKKLALHHEIYVGILLGITTISTAFATFSGSLWNSTSVANYSKSIEATNNANTAYLEYSQSYLDQKLIMMQSHIENLSEKERDEALQNIEKETSAVSKKEYEDFSTLSEELMTKADSANSANDKFSLMSALYSIVLFLGSLSLLVKSNSGKVVFSSIATLLFICVFVWMLTLPFPSL